MCPKNEAVRLAHLYDDVEIVVQPDFSWTIARKREWIMREWLACGYDKILMLDDDLRFATRISESDRRLRDIRNEELGAEMQRLEDKLGPAYPHVGFGPRQGNNNMAGGGWKTPSRMMSAITSR